MQRLALASVVANAAIVVTGGAVRLTSSGLGCPTWPRCTSGSYTPTSAYAAHGVIEFTNRLLTFALTAVVVATLVAVVRQRPRRTPLVRLASLLVAGIPAQAVLGGITVLTGLNPWTVMAHFLLSMVLLAFAVLLHRRSGEGDGHPRDAAPLLLRRLSYGVLATVAATLAIGTVVTGSGPHSGDPKAGRTGFDPASVSQLHADLVMLLVGLSVALWVALRAVPAPSRAAGMLVLVEVGQAAIGWTQYFTHLPVVLVGAHLAGACLVLIAATRVVLSLRERPSAAEDAAVERAAEDPLRVQLVP
ncbi:MAG: heme a synthase [Actinomycetota bacterium]|nr:heme a synthase [Actinomycetota bacterium]